MRLAALTLLLASAVALAEPMGPAAPATTDSGAAECVDCGPAGDPAVYPGEVVAPPAEGEDGWGGNPPPWFEDPRSLDCNAHPGWCQTPTYESAKTAEGDRV